MSLQYVDASVILRIIINAAGALPEGTLLYPTSSALLQVECLRTLDRFQISGELKRDEIPRSYAALHEAMSRIQLLKIDEKIVERAGGPFGVPLKTLDAIHLVTAIAWRERLNEEVTFLTHDNQLATAAREHDFPVIGAPKETETSAQ